MEDTGVHVINDASGTVSHLAITGRQTAVCGESIGGGVDLGVLVVASPAQHRRVVHGVHRDLVDLAWP